MIEIFDSISNFSGGTIHLVGSNCNDPTPDLIDFAPDCNYAFMNLRGPNPLTGNHKDVHNAKWSTLGVAVIKVLHAEKGGAIIGILRLTKMVDGKKQRIPMALR